MELSSLEIGSLVLCYLAVGLMLGLEHWQEYYKYPHSFFTTVDIEWPWFLFKLLAWPLYVCGVTLVLMFVAVMAVVMALD